MVSIDTYVRDLVRYVKAEYPRFSVILFLNDDKLCRYIRRTYSVEGVRCKPYIPYLKQYIGEVINATRSSEYSYETLLDEIRTLSYIFTLPYKLYDKIAEYSDIEPVIVAKSMRFFHQIFKPRNMYAVKHAVELINSSMENPIEINREELRYLIDPDFHIYKIYMVETLDGFKKKRYLFKYPETLEDLVHILATNMKTSTRKISIYPYDETMLDIIRDLYRYMVRKHGK